MKLKYFSIGGQVFFWFITFILIIVWLHQTNSIDAYIALIGALSSAFAAAFAQFQQAIEAEELLPKALASGYAVNFIEPVLTQLLKSGKKPLIYIYIPQKISELLPKSIDRKKTEFRQSSKTIKITLDEGRGSRDIILFEEYKKNGHDVYFDFPNTLLTLDSLINYRVRNGLPEEKEQKLIDKYITTFKKSLTKQLTEKELYPQHIRFTDKNLDFLKES